MNSEAAMARVGLWLLVGVCAQIRLVTTESLITWVMAWIALLLAGVVLFMAAYPRGVRNEW